jgi:AcrR family transcriptional regulator
MNKKEIILNVALQLFSNRGFDNTSTSLIAQKAEVSEGLIFRHFTNKEGLLNAILMDGFTKIEPFLADILAESDPKKVIRMVLELPLKIIAEQKEFWKLQTNLRFQNEGFRKNFEENDFFKPLDLKVLNALKALNSKNPTVDFETFFVFLNGLGMYCLEHDDTAMAFQIIKNIEAIFIK